MSDYVVDLETRIEELEEKLERKTYINLNAIVRVSLTAHGVNCIKNHYKKLDLLHQFPKKIEKTNCYTGTLWELMNIFGELTYMGSTRIPFVYNDIQVIENGGL